MCSSDPDVPAEGNKAKCVGLVCFILSIFSMIGFATGGVLGGLGGLCACIAWALMQCCYKGSQGPEKGKKIYRSENDMWRGLVNRMAPLFQKKRSWI